MSNRIPLILLTWIVSFWIILAISPLNRHDWFLENILFVIFFFTLIFSYKKFPLSNISYFLITIFLSLHLIGAHYTYEKVPLGYQISEIFNLQRNHFDRIIHFTFGLLLTFPIREFLIRATNIRVRGFFSFYLPIDIILACSAFFEIIEWLLVSVVNPELGAAYLGTQGDIWDAQKDMIAALVGSLLSCTITFSKDLISKS